MLDVSRMGRTRCGAAIDRRSDGTDTEMDRAVRERIVACLKGIEGVSKGRLRIDAVVGWTNLVSGVLIILGILYLLWTTVGPTAG